MFHNLEEDQSILNFSYLTAVFYQFFTISVKNFEKMNLQESKYEINKEFDDLNLNNLMDYLGYMSDLTKNDEVIKQKKKNIFKTVFNFDFNENEKDRIFHECSQKMNIDKLNNNNELYKLLNKYIINFNFEIYQIFYLVVKKMEKCKDEELQKKIVENLLEEDKIRKEKTNNEKKLLNENKQLKGKIKTLNKNEENLKNLESKNKQLIDEMTKMKMEIKKLNENVKNLILQNENEAIKFKDDIKDIKHQNEKETMKLKEDIKNIKIENENFRKQLENIKKENASLIKEKEEKKNKKFEERYENMKKLNIEIILEESSYNEVFNSYKAKILNLIKENQRLDLLNSELNINKQKNEAEIKRLQNLLKLYDLDLEVKKELEKNKDLP